MAEQDIITRMATILEEIIDDDYMRGMMSLCMIEDIENVLHEVSRDA